LNVGDRRLGRSPGSIVEVQLNPLLSDGLTLVTPLRRAGVVVEQRTFPGVTHEFFGMGAVVRGALQWRTPGGLPFPMPVVVRVGDTTGTVAMTGGHGEFALPSPATHYILDPDSKLLRQDDAMDRFRDWTTAQNDSSQAEPRGESRR
jgi:hypothetical protein